MAEKSGESGGDFVKNESIFEDSLNMSIITCIMEMGFGQYQPFAYHLIFSFIVIF